LPVGVGVQEHEHEHLHLHAQGLWQTQAHLFMTLTMGVSSIIPKIALKSSAVGIAQPFTAIVTATLISLLHFLSGFAFCVQAKTQWFLLCTFLLRYAPFVQLCCFFFAVVNPNY
jgi:hypothetical protein